MLMEQQAIEDLFFEFVDENPEWDSPEFYRGGLVDGWWRLCIKFECSREFVWWMCGRGVVSADYAAHLDRGLRQRIAERNAQWN